MRRGSSRGVESEKTAAVAVCLHIRDIAYSLAKRGGMNEDVAVDCAHAFLAHLLTTQPQRLLSFANDAQSERWLRRCAANFVLNAIRHNRIVRQCEVPWPHYASRSGDALPLDARSAEAPVEAGVLRAELYSRVSAAIGACSLSQTDLLAASSEHDVSAQEAGARTCAASGTVRQREFRSRLRLRSLLAERGLTEAELRDYLRECAPGKVTLCHPPALDE